jgi:uncharacterized protein (TIGR03084 family)
MPVDMAALAGDVAAETAVTRALVAGLSEDDWHTATPAPGWDIADQISHLAHFDQVAVQAAGYPGDFRAEQVHPDAIAARYRDRTGAQLLAWFDQARADLLATYTNIDPATRLPWFGPPMSAASSLTARFMETWAHSQDIADALGVTRDPTDRLCHVAHIGVGARAYSYAANGRPQPSTPVHVSLIAPSGAAWTWGPADAADRISGPALDFCLLVTQRRHRDDLSLTAEGPAAAEWMTIAQAFAGPPGPGRRPRNAHA